MRKEIQALCEKTKAEVQEVLSAPVVDPEAPDGYLRPAIAEAEHARRLDQVQAAIGRLVYTIECRYGPKAGISARKHFESCFREAGITGGSHD